MGRLEDRRLTIEDRRRRFSFVDPQSSWRLLLLLSTGLFSWLAMMIVHELGHVVHAWLSGGTVDRVVLHPLAISRTDVLPNPHPLFVVWGGPLWGCGLPLVIWLAVRRIKTRSATDGRGFIGALAGFFAGFCLIANGGYLGAGVWHPVGDARRLLELGTFSWMLAVFALFTLPAGFWLWHGLGPEFGLGRTPRTVDPKAALSMTAAVILIVLLELALSNPV